MRVDGSQVLDRYEVRKKVLTGPVDLLPAEGVNEPMSDVVWYALLVCPDRKVEAVVEHYSGGDVYGEESAVMLETIDPQKLAVYRGSGSGEALLLPRPGSRGALLLPSPLRTTRKPFGLCRSSLSQGPSRDPVGHSLHLHDTGLGPASVTRRRPHQQRGCRHLLCLLSQLFRRSRAETPEGSQPAFAWGDLAGGLNPYPPGYRTAFASSLILYPPSHRRHLAVGLPEGRTTGLPRPMDESRMV